MSSHQTNKQSKQSTLPGCGQYRAPFHGREHWTKWKQPSVSLFPLCWCHKVSISLSFCLQDDLAMVHCTLILWTRNNPVFRLLFVRYFVTAMIQVTNTIYKVAITARRWLRWMQRWRVNAKVFNLHAAAQMRILIQHSEWQDCAVCFEQWRRP